MLQPVSGLKPGWGCGAAEEMADDATDGNELLAAEGEAAMLTSPVKRLRRGSAQRPAPPPLAEAEAEGSKVKRPLYARGGRRGAGGGRLCRSGRSDRRSDRQRKRVPSIRATR